MFNKEGVSKINLILAHKYRKYMYKAIHKAQEVLNLTPLKIFYPVEAPSLVSLLASHVL